MIAWMLATEKDREIGGGRREEPSTIVMPRDLFSRVVETHLYVLSVL